MKIWNLGSIELMMEDYMGSKKQPEIFWNDYTRARFKDLKALKSEGWRAPTYEEGLYLFSLHKMGIGGFTETRAEGYYFIDLGKGEEYWGANAIKMSTGKMWRISSLNMANLRLVRSV